MFLGNINTVPSIVNLPGQGGASPAPSTFDFAFANQSNNSFQVDATEYPNPQQYNAIPSSYSISCLIKIDDGFFVNPSAGNTLTYRIVDKENIQAGTPRGYGLHLVNTTSSGGNNVRAFRVAAYRSGNNIGNGRAQFNIGNNLSAGIIYFVVATFDGNGQIKLYVKDSSGQPFSTQTRNLTAGTGDILNSTGAFTIGNTSPSSATQGYGGELDEVAIWRNITLTPTQVDTLTTLYRDNDSVDLSTALTGNTQPSAWYKMGEGATFSSNVWNMPNDGTRSDFKNLKSDNVLRSARKTPGLVPQF